MLRASFEMWKKILIQFDMKSCILSSEGSLKDELSGDLKFCWYYHWLAKTSFFFPIFWFLLVVKVCLYYKNSGRPGNNIFSECSYFSMYGSNMRENGDSVNIDWLSKLYFGVFICLFAKELLNYSFEIWNLIHFRGFIANKLIKLKSTLRQKNT